MAPGGTATVVWEDRSAPDYRIEGRNRTSGNVWGPVKTLSDLPGNAQDPRVAAGTGGATALWRQYDPGAPRVSSRQWIAGSWRPMSILSPGGGPTAFDPDVAMEETGGEAIAIWARSDGADARIEVSAGR